jgi:uncharacterized damage-inducible protein DinB
VTDLASALANEIERTVTGPMWHGSALNELLAGVTFEQAAAKPIPRAHSIWELVLHITAWSNIARERLSHRSLDSVPPEVDFPPVPTPTEQAWADAKARLLESHQALARATESLSADALAAVVPVPKPRYTVSTLLHGVIEHGTYHGGQIALLKRALERT